MRELRHPWMLVHIQVRKSRQRCTKPRRQYGLSGATSLLSLGYLFCHIRNLWKVLEGSLEPTFVPAFLAVRNTVRWAFALALNSRFPPWMSSSLCPTDIFSAGCRPSQTAHKLLFPHKESKLTHKWWVVLHGCSTIARAMASTLPLILCIIHMITTTCCSKGPQGLSFPLGVTGLFTGQCFQKVLIRDSDHLIKPFMQVINQMTRYYAQFCYSRFLEGFIISVKLCMSPCSSDYIFTFVFGV